MYSLDCKYYNEEFDNLGDLLDHIRIVGMDPSFEITKDGEGTGETAWELIGPLA